MSSRPDSQIFEDLFVLELANNHWGNARPRPEDHP